MIRTVFFMAIFIAGMISFPAAQLSSTQQDLDKLQQQRLTLLADRVAEMKTLFNDAFVSKSAFIRSEIDLIQARLDYAKTANGKRRVLKEMLTKYDDLIEVAELMLEAPAPQRSATAKSELLMMKSEKVRIEIMLASVN